MVWRTAAANRAAGSGQTGSAVGRRRIVPGRAMASRTVRKVACAPKTGSKRGCVGGDSVDRLLGLDGVDSEIVMMRTPDGHGRIELDKFHAPPAVGTEAGDAPVNALGIRRIMFAVDDLDAVLARLRDHGGEPVGEVVRYEEGYLLCYVRGPDGIMVALAEAPA